MSDVKCHRCGEVYSCELFEEQGLCQTSLATEPKTAYVICANDSAKAVVLDDAKRAKEALVEISEKYYNNHRHIYNSKADFENYISWHIQKTEVF